MRVDELALALQNREALKARLLYAQLQEVNLRDIEAPTVRDELALAIAASVIELLASRLGQPAPEWTRHVAPLSTEYALVTVRLPEKLERLRRETPPQLRARNLIAPEGFLLAV